LPPRPWNCCPAWIAGGPAAADAAGSADLSDTQKNYRCVIFLLRCHDIGENYNYMILLQQ